MRRFRHGLGLVLWLVAPLTAASPVAAAADPSAGPATDRERARFDVVVIDPGHGGPDPGARGQGKLTEKRVVFEIARRLGAELEAQSRDDAAKLLGHRPATWAESDAALEALVLEAPPERTGEILRLLHRHALRQEFLLAPALREIEGAKVQLLD